LRHEDHLNLILAPDFYPPDLTSQPLLTHCRHEFFFSGWFQWAGVHAARKAIFCQLMDIGRLAINETYLSILIETGEIDL